ncbi:hypothetical protein BBEV_0312 [Salisediminibacterium beveridgei]|uniref:HTH cro/C1-type domain-containing protein n=2 Tax=Salisediminibacterium beveridgei TaxID=632773 RepID=A0A1D7QRS0_9BACI|nr:hypothetical protein BBEV_0312 [Salisediminibacterium beveridgei]
MDNSFGQNVRLYRKSKDLRLEQLASMTGLHLSALSQIENGKRDPTLSIVLKISESLDIPISNLVANENRFQHKIFTIYSFRPNHDANSEIIYLIAGHSSHPVSGKSIGWGVSAPSMTDIKNLSLEFMVDTAANPSNSTDELKETVIIDYVETELKKNRLALSSFPKEYIWEVRKSFSAEIISVIKNDMKKFFTKNHLFSQGTFNHIRQ